MIGEKEKSPNSTEEAEPQSQVTNLITLVLTVVVLGYFANLNIDLVREAAQALFAGESSPAFRILGIRFLKLVGLLFILALAVKILNPKTWTSDK